MRSTSETARRLLDCLLGGEPWPRAWLGELIEQDSPALFSVVAEGLSDRFEPRLVEAYTAVFAEAIAAVRPEYRAADLVERYERVRRPRRFAGEARTVFVLSRVTLGAEVAITSVMLDAIKRRWPEARIVLVGPRKCWELFEADPRIEHLPVRYEGALRDRLAVTPRLAEPDSMVVDTDSRITQLGLLPVCPKRTTPCSRAAPMAATAGKRWERWRAAGPRRHSGSTTHGRTSRPRRSRTSRPAASP